MLTGSHGQWATSAAVSASLCPPPVALTQLGLAAIGHLYKCILLLVEQNLHPLHITIDAFEAQGQRMRYLAS